MKRNVRQTLTIARRDFIATVFTPTFLIFLLAPLIMASFGAIGGLGAATMAEGSADRTRVVAIVPADVAPIVGRVDQTLRTVFREHEAPPELRIDAPGDDPAAQARALFHDKTIEASAVLYGPLDAPTILYGPQGERTADYMAELAEQTLRAQAAGGAALSAPTKELVERETSSVSGQHQAAFFTVFGIFILTILLAGQAVGTMAEERSNKVIEVLAAAVPLESVFLGKLIGMFGVAIVFVAFWGTIAAQVGTFLPAEMVQAFSDVGPAVGFPVFLLLFFAYFTMAYMLLGAVFLGVGAQASTIREIQMLSLPITILQVAMFGWASAAASNPDSWIATAAEIFPLSSPFAMAAHAANYPQLWPHFLALAWQLLWVSIVIWLSAGWFRRGVLQSGGGRRWFFKSRVAKAASELPMP
jgi:ABC-2 type transport system permease protein